MQDTINNTDCSIWYRLYSVGSTAGTDTDGSGSVIFPSGNTILSYSNNTGTRTDDVYGTDQSSIEADNPDTAYFRVAVDNGEDDGTIALDCLVLCYGSATGLGGIDYNTDYSIPVFTDLTSETNDFLYIEFGSSVDVDDNVVNVVPVINHNFNINPNLMFSNDASNYSSCENSTLFRPSTTAKKRLIKVYPNFGAATGGITEYAIKYNLY